MKSSGFTLIELIIFIILVGISAGVLIPLFTVLTNVHRIDYSTQALELAGQRMEIILKEKYSNDFANLVDPCSGVQSTYCNTANTAGATINPAGFIVSSQIQTGYPVTGGWNNDNNFKTITVSVSGTSTATLKTMVANY